MTDSTNWPACGICGTLIYDLSDVVIDIEDRKECHGTCLANKYGSDVVLKVQVSMRTTEADRQTLVYNEDKSIYGQFPVDEYIQACMGDELKRYFYAHLEGTKVTLDGIAPEQDW